MFKTKKREKKFSKSSSISQKKNKKNPEEFGDKNRQEPKVSPNSALNGSDFKKIRE